jgi:hypothetical protein
LADSHSIKENDKIQLHKITKANAFLEGKTGTVELIFREDSERKGKILFMIYMDDEKSHNRISDNNIKREGKSQKTGYCRHGQLMNEDFSICTLYKMTRLGSSENVD